MPRWLRIIRGMLGTGLTFGVGIGTVTAIVITIVGLAKGIWSPGIYGMAGRFGVAGFLLGVAFSGALAIVARRESLRRMSLGLFATLGAGAGLVYFGLISLNAYRVWTVGDAITNFITLTVMGAGAAAATWWIARKAGALVAGPDVSAIGEGAAEPVGQRERLRERLQQKPPS